VQVYAKKSVAVISGSIYVAMLEAILQLCKKFGESESRCHNRWFLAGITGRYGAERIQAPGWLRRSAYYSMNAGYRLVLSPFRFLRKRFSKRTLPFGTNEVLQ